jgi:inosine triphosphate pyrophosphatase
MKQPVFITGNQHKADYLSRQLGIELPHQKVELDELQSTDLHVIVEHKLRQAYDKVNAPVLAEDVSLEYTALNGLPGPYIKWFIEEAGEQSCCRMLDGFTDRSAIIKCTFGYYDGNTMTFFDSEYAGSISEEPRGTNGFGFDAFFIVDGMEITRAEMTPEENERTYAKYMKPFDAVKKFLSEVE